MRAKVVLRESANQALPAAGGYRETGSPFYSAALLAAVASSLEIALA